MNVYLMKSPHKLPHLPCVYMVLANPTYVSVLPGRGSFFFPDAGIVLAFKQLDFDDCQFTPPYRSSAKHGQSQQQIQAVAFDSKRLCLHAQS